MSGVSTGGGLGPAIVAAMLLALIATPPAALEVCRPNALGQIACLGEPTPGLSIPEPFVSTVTGLSRVLPRRRTDAPSFVPGIDTNGFGATILREGESSRPKPRICRADGFGNLRC